MNKKCIALILLLLLIIVGGAYKFMIQGSVSSGSDGRTSIHLSTGERDLVFKEMRAFLESVQQITKGISNNEMALVAEYAKKVGRAAQNEVPVTLMGKLPIAFKKLGFDTHSKFDLLALDAESIGDSSHSLTQLSELLENCVACHATYRLEVSEK